MCDIKWMKTSAMLLLLLLLLLLLRASAALVHEHGDTVSLSCDNAIADQTECDATTWVFYRARNKGVEVVTLGQVASTGLHLNHAHRLKVLANCSLEIKSVTAEDAGSYRCQQYLSGKKQGEDTQVDLAVVTMSEAKNSDKATLNCSVAAHRPCRVNVHFMFRGADDKKPRPLQSSEHGCMVSQTFLVYQQEFKERLTSLLCIVDIDGGKTFLFHPQPSGRNTGMTTQSTTTAPDSLPTDLKVSPDWWWQCVIASVLLAAACALTCGTVLWCKRNKGRKAHTTDNVSINRNMGAGNRRCSDAVQANEEDGVFYTSIDFTRNREAKVRDKNDKSRFEEVTYSTVKASSTDPNHICTSANPSS